MSLDEIEIRIKLLELELKLSSLQEPPSSEGKKYQAFIIEVLVKTLIKIVIEGLVSKVGK